MLFFHRILIMSHNKEFLWNLILFNWAINHCIILCKLLTLFQRILFQVDVGQLLDLTGEIIINLRSAFVEAIIHYEWVVVSDVLCWGTRDSVMMLKDRHGVHSWPMSAECFFNIRVTYFLINHSSSKKSSLSMEQGWVSFDLLFKTRSWSEKPSPILIFLTCIWEKVVIILWPGNILLLDGIHVLRRGWVNKRHVFSLNLVALLYKLINHLELWKSIHICEVISEHNDYVLFTCIPLCWILHIIDKIVALVHDVVVNHVFLILYWSVGIGTLVVLKNVFNCRIVVREDMRSRRHD